MGKVLGFLLSVLLTVAGFILPIKSNPKKEAVKAVARPVIMQVSKRIVGTTVNAARVAGQRTVSAGSRVATSTAAAAAKTRQAAAVAGAKTVEILKSDKTRKALTATAITAGAAEVGNFAYENYKNSGNNGEAFAATLPPPEPEPVRTRAIPKPEPERRRSVNLADPDKL